VTIVVLLGTENHKRRIFGHHLCAYMETIDGKQTKLIDVRDVVARNLHKCMFDSASHDFVVNDISTIDHHRATLNQKDSLLWVAKIAHEICRETDVGYKHVVITGLKSRAEIETFRDEYKAVNVYLFDPMEDREDEAWRPPKVWKNIPVSDDTDYATVAGELAEVWFQELLSGEPAEKIPEIERYGIIDYDSWRDAQ